MKPIDVISDSSAEYNEDSHVTKDRFKVGDCDSISKYKSKIGQKFLLLAKLKIQFRGHTWLVTWMVNDYEKELQKTNQK